MSSNSGMSISNLIRSSAQVKGFSLENTFSEKKFGEIYMYNKKVKVKPKNSVIEVSMMIKGATEKVVKKGQRETMAAHRVMVAISGVEQEEIPPEKLVIKIRGENTAYQDTEKYPDEYILSKILSSDQSNPQNKFLPGKTIFEGDKGNFVIVTDNIKSSAQILVWCSCSSYYWVFQYYNIAAGVNIPLPGRPASMGTYKYKTQKGLDQAKKGKPMRNPSKAPGLCKHLMLLLALLMDSHVVKPTSKTAQRLDTSYSLNMNKFKKVDRLSKSGYDKLIRDFDKDLRLKRYERRRYAAWSGIASSQRSNSKKGFFNEEFLRKMR